jgi:putative transposase
MNKQELEAFAKRAAKGIKSEDDLNDFRAMLTKVTVEAALNAELEHHLGYQKNEKTLTNNSRNGYSSKTVKTEEGSFQLDTPRDTASAF